MFLSYWKVYVWMVVVVSFLNADLFWFCQRTFIDDGVYMRLKGGERSKAAPSVLM